MTKVFTRILLIALLLCCCVTAMAIVPRGWEGISPGGIDGDAENSYAWSMEVLGDYLYVGTNRNVVGSMLEGILPPDQPWPAVVPVPTDVRGRIYRINLTASGGWECYYVAPPVGTDPIGPDIGYRMMKTYTTKASGPVLYVGSLGEGSCNLLAITPTAASPVPVFQASAPGGLPLGFSVRAIAEHNRQLFWASDRLDVVHKRMMPVIWYSPDPLKAYQQDPAVVFPSIDVPSDWFPQGAEIMDMISYNGALYVFFLPHDFTPANMGFWVGKLKQNNPGAWVWQLVVGDTALGAKYPQGLGDPMNGGATSPILFNGKIYVGTGSSTMVQFFVTGRFDLMDVDPLTVGAKIYRFDKRDNWERVQPPAVLNDPRLNGFVNPLNQYMWRFGVCGNKLYVGTFDARTLVDELGPLFPEYAALLDQFTLINPAGFDMFSTTDGTIWLPESLNGFNDSFNYGGRSFVNDPKTGDLFLGTANPFTGCQIWRKSRLTP